MVSVEMGAVKGTSVLTACLWSQELNYWKAEHSDYSKWQE